MASEEREWVDISAVSVVVLRMIDVWMCGMKVTDGFMCCELRERLGTDDVSTIVQRRRWRRYGHVLRKDENDWVKKCVDYEVEGVRLQARPKKTLSEIIEKDCQTWQICKRDVMDRRKWRKLKMLYNSHKDRVWVSECFSGTGSPGLPWIKGR